MALQVDLNSLNAKAEKECNFKILIPASAIGSIMGRNGGAVHELESHTGTKISISGLRDCYPGTRERVCLMSGMMKNVLRVNRIIMQKMSANTDCSGGSRQNFLPNITLWRSRQVKIIIPQSFASKVIGKGGSNVEKMKAESGSFIQLSRKAFPIILRERCVTVSGEIDCNDKACRMILQIIAEETNADYYRNVSYSRASFPLPNSHMSGPPFAKAKYNLTAGAPESSVALHDMPLFLKTLKETLRNMSYSEGVVKETSDALHSLNNNKVLDICLSMLVNWFYPRSYAVYERNGGVPRSPNLPYFGRASSTFPQSMFASAESEPMFGSMMSLEAGIDPVVQTLARVSRASSIADLRMNFLLDDVNFRNDAQPY